MDLATQPLESILNSWSAESTVFARATSPPASSSPKHYSGYQQT